MEHYVTKSNKEDPYNRYTTTFYAGPGNMLVALNGIEQDKTKNLCWMIYDERTGQQIPVGMDSYQPVDMSTTSFKFEECVSEGRCVKVGALCKPRVHKSRFIVCFHISCDL